MPSHRNIGGNAAKRASRSEATEPCFVVEQNAPETAGMEATGCLAQLLSELLEKHGYGPWGVAFSGSMTFVQFRHVGVRWMSARVQSEMVDSFAPHRLGLIRSAR